MAPIVEADASSPVLDAAGRYGVSPRQVALAWLLARSPQILPIPGSGPRNMPSRTPWPQAST
jgi:aryl-alcohol dehydrogenase-like predicted oxidoreductase